MLRPDDWQQLDGTPSQVATSVEASAAFLDSDEDDNWVVQVHSREGVLQALEMACALLWEAALP